jgi:hypothetical protein
MRWHIVWFGTLVKFRHIYCLNLQDKKQSSALNMDTELVPPKRQYKRIKVKVIVTFQYTII